MEDVAGKYQKFMAVWGQQIGVSSLVAVRHF